MNLSKHERFSLTLFKWFDRNGTDRIDYKVLNTIPDVDVDLKKDEPNILIRIQSTAI